MFDVEALNVFYEEVSAPPGMSVAIFHNKLTALFTDQRATDDIGNYRLGRPPWKKLRDEIAPISRFLKFNNVEADRVRFPLDNKVPDCWLMTDNGDKLGVEVTIERGREQYHLATELNEKGMGRGFIGIQDDAPQTDFDNRMVNPRVMFSSEQALKATKAGILRCLSRKDNSKYEKVFYLLIQAHLTTLPKERWSAIIEELSQAAKRLPFQEIHVIGNADEEPWGFRIK